MQTYRAEAVDQWLDQCKLLPSLEVISIYIYIYILAYTSNVHQPGTRT